MTSDNKLNIKYLWLMAFVAAMGGFLFGYDWVVVGGAKNFYEPYFGITTPTMKGWATSSALIGCVFGALLCFALSDKFGRRRLLILSGFLFALAAIGTAMAGSFMFYNIFRIVGGFGIGITLNLSPMYISEMSPPNMRGKFVSVNQLMIMIGILAAQTVNWRISLLDTEMPAMDVRLTSNSCNFIFYYDDHYARECPLAGEKRRRCQSQESFNQNRRCSLCRGGSFRN